MGGVLAARVGYRFVPLPHPLSPKTVNRVLVHLNGASPTKDLRSVGCPATVFPPVAGAAIQKNKQPNQCLKCYRLTSPHQSLSF